MSAVPLSDVSQATMRTATIHEAAALTSTAIAIGFEVVWVDMAGCSSKDELLDRFARAFAFPAWFGRNWDALADSLSDLSWRPAPGYVLVLEHIIELASRHGEGADMLRGILRDTTTEWAKRGVPFWTLLLVH